MKESQGTTNEDIEKENIKQNFRATQGKATTRRLNNQVRVFEETIDGIQRLKVKVSQDITNRYIW